MPAMPARRVLVLERDEPLRTTITAVLASVGYVVDAAADVADALALADAACPDAALVHVGRPEGWRLVRALREDGRTCTVPIVAMGGSPVTHHAREPMVMAVEGYLHKPWDPDYLLAVVAGALRGGGVADQSRGSERAPAP